MGSGRYCFSPLAKYSRYTCVDEDDDVLELLARTELSSSNCQIVLNLLSPMLFLPIGMSYYSVLFVLFFHPRQMRPNVDPPSARHSAPRSTRALFLSCTSSVSATPSLYSLIRTFPVKVFSIIFLIRSPHAFLCGLIVLPCDVISAQLGEPPV